MTLVREEGAHFDAVLRKRASLRGDCDLDSNKEAVGSFLPTAFSIGVTGSESFFTPCFYSSHPLFKALLL